MCRKIESLLLVFVLLLQFSLPLFSSEVPGLPELIDGLEMKLLQLKAQQIEQITNYNLLLEQFEQQGSLLEEQQRDLENSKNQIESLQKEITSLSELIEKLKKQLSESQAEVSKVQGSLKKALSMSDRLEKQLYLNRVGGIVAIILAFIFGLIVG